MIFLLAKISFLKIFLFNIYNVKIFLLGDNMKIRKEDIEKDINQLIEMLRKTIFVDEYKYILNNINLLLGLYETLFNQKYECEINSSTLLTYIINEKENDFNYIYTSEYLEDKDTHDKVARTLFQIIHKYNLPSSIEQEPIFIGRFENIVDSFFEDYGGGISKKYHQLKNDNQIHFIPYRTNTGSETDNIFMLGKTYTIVSDANTIDGLLTFAHEVGRAYAYSAIEENDAAYDACFSYCDFYPSFIERMMTRYLIDNKLLSRDTFKSNQKFFKELELYAMDVANLKNLSKKEILNSKKFVSMIYMYGKYLSLIKEYDYDQDREGTLEQIDEYLKRQGSISKKESLDILGIDYDELVSGNKLQKVLKKNNM